MQKRREDGTNKRSKEREDISGLFYLCYKERQGEESDEKSGKKPKYT